MERRLRSYKDLGTKLPPGGQHQGASGATAGSDSRRAGGDRGTKRTGQPMVGLPEQDNALTEDYSQNPSTSAVTTRDVSRRANPILPETTLAGRPRVRMKWTQELNILIMRTYYHITRLETDSTAFRRRLHDAFVAHYPDITVTEQRIADQRRAILNNKFLSNEILQQIKREVREELERENNIPPDPPTADDVEPAVELQQTEPTLPSQTSPNQTQSSQLEINNGASSQEPENNNQRHSTPIEVTEIAEQRSLELGELLSTTLQKYSGVDPTKRPWIPKQKTSKKFAMIVDTLNNEILPPKLDVENFTELHDLIYCTAFTAAVANGAKINEEGTRKEKKEYIPPWKRRLIKKIETKRAEIARLREYAGGNPSNKLRRKVQGIFEKYRIHTPRDRPNLVPQDFLDTLQQKLTAFSTRLSRYDKCNKKKQQNKEFKASEKRFYRTLKSNIADDTELRLDNIPNQEQINTYWSSIWDQNKSYQPGTNWLQQEEEENSEVIPMAEPTITEAIVTEVIKNTHSWKSPGSDNIHNFWYKKLTSTHTKLTEYINDFIKHPEKTPRFITEGKTYLLPKGKPSKEPSKYRPITCLQTVYKIITSCITNLLNTHVEEQTIMTEEQKGCRKGTKGCKEQLIMDSIILNEVKKKHKKLSCCYIDYQKAYDSVPHSWLIKVLEIYKVHPALVMYLRHLMLAWRTVIQLNTKAVSIVTQEIKINCGIFQGDSLSPLWFCLALNPLSRQLNRTGIGYTLKEGQVKHTVSHQLYMDDLKLYAPSHNKLKELIMLVEQFSKDIGMTFGLDKCKIINIEKGKCKTGEVQLTDGGLMESMLEEDTYKYLGYQQARSIDHTSIKENLSKEYLSRVNRICKAELNSKHLFKAINTLAIPVLTYSFGVIAWTDTDLDNVMRKTRTTLTKYRKHHPKASTLRMTIPRGEGGRGLIDIKNLHNGQVKLLRTYFYQRKQTSPLHRSACLADRAYTPLNLANGAEQANEIINSKADKHQEWRNKALHGRHPHDLDQPYVDKAASNAWLRSGELFPETEGFMIAIQDQVVNTRNYLKHIVKDPQIQDDKCRKCREKPETIQHITTACSLLSQSDYLHRHNQVAAIIHQELCFRLEICHHTPRTPYYKYEPPAVTETSQYTIYYDRSIITDRTIPYNKPDIVVRDKREKEAFIIDVAVPNTHNLLNTIAEKKRKYTDLADEIKKMWGLKKVIILPIVVAATGVIPKELHRSLEILGLHKNLYQLLQKAVILNTTRIVRRFLSQE